MKKTIKQPTKKEPTINKDTAHRNIAEWLYINDCSYSNKTSWRIALIKMLEWNIKHIK